MGLEASQSNLDVSQSCNEVSIGADYSVDDSLELEKCDFVEEVKVGESESDHLGTSNKPMGRLVGLSGGDALDSLMPGRLTGVKPGDATSAPLRDNHAAVASTSASLAKPIMTEAREDEENENYDESFDNDDLSVAEEIEESLENSGSE